MHNYRMIERRSWGSYRMGIEWLQDCMRMFTNSYLFVIGLLQYGIRKNSLRMVLGCYMKVIGSFQEGCWIVIGWLWDGHRIVLG